MSNDQNNTITVAATINAGVEKVWQFWTNPEHITKWAFASDDWHAPYADNDARTGGKFKTTMAAKDGSFSFDFEGVYDTVEEHALIEYTMADGRWVKVRFSGDDKATTVTEEFVPENQNSPEMQKGGWQAILDNFKKHVESN